MTSDRRFSLGSAIQAARADETPLWVGDFLASRGSDNAMLAAALATKRHWWIGPTQLPVEDLVRLAGPEDDALVPIEEGEWEQDVESMAESLEEGWQPPPLLVEFQDGKLFLQDGNHRYEALVRAGEAQAWVLIYFPTEAERDTFATGMD